MNETLIFLEVFPQTFNTLIPVSFALAKAHVELLIWWEASAGLVWLYGISTIAGYLMPNLFLYI